MRGPLDSLQVLLMTAIVPIPAVEVDIIILVSLESSFGFLQMILPDFVTGLTSKSIRETSVAVLNAVGPGQANIKRSNTSAAQLTSVGGHLTTKLDPVNQNLTSSNGGGSNVRRSHNTGYYSFRDYSPVYGTATLSRGPRAYG